MSSGALKQKLVEESNSKQKAAKLRSKHAAALLAKNVDEWLMADALFMHKH